MGQDTDSIFAYQTPKVVKIYDRTLGIMKNVLTLAIFIYIFIFSIWFNGAHFAKTSVEGLAQLQWQEPVKKCNPYKLECEANFESTRKLKYCSQYQGKDPAAVQYECNFYDARELPVTLPSGIMLPTCTFAYHQVNSCDSGSPTCARPWKYLNKEGKVQQGTGYPEPASVYYVADAGSFTLLIDHKFKTTNGVISKDDKTMQGYFRDCDPDGKGGFKCDEIKPIKCVHDQCDELNMIKALAEPSLLDMAHSRWNSSWVRTRPNVRGADHHMLNPGHDETALNLAQEEASESKEPKVIAISDGDVLSLNTMMQLAGKSLDEPINNEDGTVGTIRKRGIALVVTIKYENYRHWTLLTPPEPWYTISVEALQGDKIKHATVQETPNGHKRDMFLQYGTLIIVQQTGLLSYLDPVAALVSFTSAMALLAASTTLTEMLMLYAMPRKKEYTELKYQESQDFNDEEDAKAQS